MEKKEPKFLTETQADQTASPEQLEEWRQTQKAEAYKKALKEGRSLPVATIALRASGQKK